VTTAIWDYVFGSQISSGARVVNVTAQRAE